VTSAEYEARLAELELRLTAKYETRIAELEALLADRDKKLAIYTAALVEKDAAIMAQQRLVEELTAKVQKLSEQLARNSRNSNLPPSTDPPGRGSSSGRANSGRNRRGKEKRKRGGQKGHPGAHRGLVPQDQVTEFVDFYPEQCERCCASLPETPDPCAKRYQWVELPIVRPDVKEFRRHAVDCPDCGHKTLAAYEADEIPQSPFGPRLMGVAAGLTGIFRLSRRQTLNLLSDLFGLRLSLGALSSIESRVADAIEPSTQEAWDEVANADVHHSDGTSWLQSGSLMVLWTIATASATVFKVLADSSKKTLETLHQRLSGILVSDRAKSLRFWAMHLRQICWAHLVRKFISFSERAGPAGPIGRELLDYTVIIFDYWHAYKDGKLSREQLSERVAPVRVQIEALLERAVAKKIPRLSGSCADILEHRPALWTFVDRESVQPTNNHGEQEVRAFVLWRRTSFGSQSERGNLFAERIMTIRHTARKQGKNALDFICACCKAKLEGTPMPSLISPRRTAHC
jgi:transposase